ncbi:MAG: TRAP transporter large permease [Treponema sp.]|nr:TRAP transporter large permease [Treponema sp.]
MAAILVVLFILFVAIGVPISFSLGLVSFVGIFALPDIPNMIVFTKMFNGLNSFTLLAVPLFILAANIMNEGNITDRLIRWCNALVGHRRGGLAYSNILVSMIFAGISGSSQADTAGIGSVFIPAMKKEGYDDGTSVGVTAASSTLGSIIPPSIIMVVYSGIANVSTGALFMTGLVPGILLGLAMMAIVWWQRSRFPAGKKVSAKEMLSLTKESVPALFTPILLIGGICSGLFTPTESSAIASLYAFSISIFYYKSITLRDIPRILVDTMKLSSLSLFALASACALGELLSYYQLNVAIQDFFSGLAAGKIAFTLIIVLFFLFVGTFMDAVPAMILFVPVILPTALSLGVNPIMLGLIIVVTLALGLVTPPYGLCLLLSASINKMRIEDAFKGTLPYLISSLVILLLMVVFPDMWIAIPTVLFPALFN